MSYFDYLACNRELPTGLFGLPPKAVYESYRAYMDSEDYVAPRNFLTGEAAEIGDEKRRKMREFKGAVVVYETFRDARYLSLEPYSPVVTRRGNAVFEPSRETMARHFALPYLYNLSVNNEATLLEYLCKYLAPGDRAEVYTCWAGEEELPRKGPERVVDLEDAVCGRYEPDRLGKDGGFTRYLAPREPQVQNPIAPIEQIDFAVQIIREDGFQGVSVSEALKQGLIRG
ncbi:MAG: hypothetical protein GX647_14095 [Clostridiales bacterium]|jgi:hypothetical protein|nr:hypothetical protein [Clostridiales bacterium]